MSWLLLLQELSVCCLNPHGFKLGPGIFLLSIPVIIYSQFASAWKHEGEKENLSFVRHPESIKIENKSTRNIVITIRHDGLSVFPGGQDHMSGKLPLTRSTWFDLYLNVS